MADRSTKVVCAALLGNVLVAVTKFIAATLSGSSAMLTEAIHSSADTANQILLLLGNSRSRAKPDPTHPFGYGMEIYFWTFVVAVLVLLAGGGASLWEGIHHLVAPKPIVSAGLSLGVLALSSVIEGISFLVGYREYKRVSRTHTIPNEHVGLWKFIKRSKDPNLYESLLEDSAALIGLAIAATGVCASAFLNLLWADGLASCAIGVLLIADAVVILLATRSLIAGESVAPPLQKDLRQAICGQTAPFRITDIATLHLGPRIILVTLKIDPPSEATAGELKLGLAEVDETLKAIDARIKYVYFRYS
jgi:cation diffusion facilitator family transporter